MKKNDLIAKIAERTGKSKAATRAVFDESVKVIAEALAEGETISLLGFGTFKVTEVKERTANNPLTKKKIKVPAHKRPVFKASPKLKESVK